MNAHRRIKNYMERHKVGSLFEDLMGKLVSEMPNDPVPFLIRQLQNKMYEVRPQTVMTVAQLRRSLGDLASTLEVEKVPVHFKPSSSLVKRRPATASTPATPSSLRKSVTLYCPTISKSTIPQKLSSPINKCEAANLYKKDGGGQNQDSFLNIPKTDYKVPTTTKALDSSKWPPKSDRNCRQILPGQILEEELLKEEFMKCPLKGLQDDNLKLKQGPQSKCLNSNGPKPVKSELENFKDKTKLNRKVDQKEVGIDLYELPEDLESEGIFICKANGFKIYKCNPKPNPKFNIAICSTCAKIMKSEDSIDDEEAILDPVTSSLATKREDITTPTNALDTGRTISSEDLFGTPRSLPLPTTPTYQYEIDWRIPSVEFLQSGSSGWNLINSDIESP